MWGILLYLFSYCGVFAYSLRFAGKNQIRCMWIYAYLFTALYVYLSTEILSLFHCVNRFGVLAAWALFLLVLGFLCIKGDLRRTWSRFLRHHPMQMVGRGIQKNKFLSFALFYFLVFTFLGAVLYAPNTYDAMTYHMTRIMHWLQNENVAYVITNDQRLNYQLPLAEYLIMHIQLLFTKDYFANLIQWNAYVTSIVAVSQIAAELGLNRRMQLLSGFVMALVPNIIFQSQSTQNDLTTGSFLLLFVLFMLKLCRTVSFRTILLAGIAMGLALATKGTAFLYIGILGPSFAVWILVNSGREWFRNAWKCSLIVLVGLGLLFPIFCRNYLLYHTILPTNPDKNRNSVYVISDLAPMEILRTCVRSMSLHLGLPAEAWNRRLQTFLEHAFGPKYLRTQNTNAGEIPPVVDFSLYEDSIGNFLHLLLFFISVLSLACSVLLLKKERIFSKEWRESKELFWYTSIVFLAMLFLFTMLCYSPWRARYHVPLFCLFSISIAYCIFTFLRPTWLRMIFYFLLFCNGLYFLHNNAAHPITWERVKTFSMERLERQKNEHLPDRKTFDALNHFKYFLEKKGIKKILFHNIGNQRDYPILKILGSAIQQDGITVKRVDCTKEEPLQYNIPYLLLVSWDTTLDRWPEIKYQIIYSHKGIFLYDLRTKVDNVIHLPAEFSFENYHPQLFFDPAYGFAEYSWVGAKSYLHLSFKEPPRHDILLHLKAHTTPVPGRYRYCFYYKNTQVGNFQVPGVEYFDFRICLPRKLIQNQKKIRLEFVAEKIISPAEAKLSSDSRPLALRPVKAILYYLDDEKRPVLPIEKPQKTIRFVRDRKSYRLISGFSSLESSGVWTVQHQALLQIPIPLSMRGKTVYCKLSGHAFLHPEKKKEQKIIIRAGQQELVHKIFSYPDTASPIVFMLPPSISKKDTVFLKFLLPDAVSPKLLGMSSDHRMLAYFLTSLQMEDSERKIFFPSEKSLTPDSPVIRFVSRGKSNFLLGDGFSSLDATGVWSASENCYLKLAVPDSLLQKELIGEMFFQTFLDQKFSLYWENHLVGTWSIPDKKSLEKVRFVVPRAANQNPNPVLRLEIQAPKSPISYKLSGDFRRLGIFLREIRLSEKELR